MRKVAADHGRPRYPITCAPRDEMDDTYVCDSPPMCLATAAVIAVGDAVGDRAIAAQREDRRTGSRKARAERAGVRSAAFLIDARPGTSGARRGSAIESSSDRDEQIEVAGVQRVDERAEIGPLPHGVRRAARSCPSSARAFAVSISRSGWTTTHGQPLRDRAAGRCPADSDGGRARSRRRSPARCCRDARRPRRGPRQ